MVEQLVGQKNESAAKVVKYTLADQVYDRIRSAIFAGEFAAGMELNQVEVAKLFGVSRVPVREALRRLQAEKLLSANPYQRYVVALLSPEQIVELHEVRTELEVFAIRQTFAAGDEVRRRRVGEASKVLRRMRHGMRPQDWLATDREFHAALNGAETAVQVIIEDLRDRVHRYLQLANVSGARYDEVLAEHAALLAAIRDGDENAAIAMMRTHAAHTRENLRQFYLEGRVAEV